MTGSLNNKILVVDDDEVAVTAVSHLLRKQGYEVIEARSGSECLSLVAKHYPDLILLDIKLPDINGVEVLKQLRGNPAFDGTFIVHLSSQVGPAETKMQGLDLGADGYISQPVENHELVARVRAFLRHKGTLDKLRESEHRYRALFESNPEPMWIYDRESLRIVAVNNAALHHYGFSRAEFLELSNRELTLEPESDVTPAARPAQFGSYTHRVKSGAAREVETNEQDITWLGRSCRVVLAHDVTERNRMDREKTQQLERLEREFRSLRHLGGDHNEPLGSDHSDVALRDRSGSIRDKIVARYSALLQASLENRVYKTDNGVSQELRLLAMELFHLHATARDVIDIHCETMRKLAPMPELPKAQALIETGRITLVEILGYLLSAYRQFCPREEVNGKQ